MAPVSERPGIDWEEEVADIVAEPPVDDPWLVQDLIRRSSYTLLAGRGKTYKSFFAQEIGIAVASGTPVFGRWAVPTSQNVLYVQEEYHRNDLRNRFAMLCQGRGTDPESLRQRLKTVTNRHLRLDQDGHIKYLHEAIRRLEIGLLILDPLREMHRRQEKDPDDMVGVLSAIKELRDRHNLAVLVVHHNSKNPDYVTPEDSLRGATTIWDASDGGIFMRPKSKASEEDQEKHGIVKLRSGIAPYRFSLTPTFSPTAGLTFATWLINESGRRIADSEIGVPKETTLEPDDGPSKMQQQLLRVIYRSDNPEPEIKEIAKAVHHTDRFIRDPLNELVSSFGYISIKKHGRKFAYPLTELGRAKASELVEPDGKRLIA